MEKQKLTLNMDPGIVDLLHRAAGDRGIGDYLSLLIADSWRDWQESLDHLTSSGWSTEELLAACDALNGKLIVARRDLGPQLAATMEDAAIIDGIAKKYNVGDTWRDRCAQVRSDNTIARALLTVAQEFWRSNRLVARALGVGD